MSNTNYTELFKCFLFGTDSPPQPLDNSDRTVVKRLDCDIVKIQFLFISERLAPKISV